MNQAFLRGEIMKKWKSFLIRRRVFLGWLFGLAFLLLANPPSLLFLVLGLEIVLCGEALRIWATGYLYKEEFLAVNGPFAYTRNPLYLGSFIIGFGFCLAAQSLNIFIVYLILFLFIYRISIKREEDTLQQKFGQEFVLYKERVPRIFPSMTPYQTNVYSEFSWGQVKKNKEWMSLIGVIILEAILFWKFYIRNY